VHPSYDEYSDEVAETEPLFIVKFSKKNWKLLGWKSEYNSKVTSG
jgi:hypothetical protein